MWGLFSNLFILIILFSMVFLQPDSLQGGGVGAGGDPPWLASKSWSKFGGIDSPSSLLPGNQSVLFSRYFYDRGKSMWASL